MTSSMDDVRKVLEVARDELHVELDKVEQAIIALEPQPAKRGPGRPRKDRSYIGPTGADDR